MTIGTQIDTGIIAVFLTFGLTALFALMGWTLKQAFNVAKAVASLEEQVEGIDARVRRLEGSHG